VAHLLIDAKAEVNCRRKRGQTPLFCAAIASHYSVGHLLLEHKADINLADDEGNRPVDISFGPLRDLLNRMLEFHHHAPRKT
jgi:ankyrin repeat protein